MLIAAVNPAGARSQPKLTGTFLQLWADHRDWPPERWETMFQNFAELELREIYVQWSVYNDIDYSAVIDVILTLAERHGMKVHLGLAFDSTFWATPENPQALEASLTARRQRSLRMAQLLSAQDRRQSSLAGWYLPEEINETVWRESQSRQILFQHLKESCRALRGMKPRKPVSISGYADIRTDPTMLAAFWSALLSEAPIDRVLLQDGIGVGNLGVGYAPAYYRVMKDAVSKRRRDMSIIIETFRQVDGDFNQKPFRAVPATFQSLLPQLEAAAPYSSQELVAFTVPDYMIPQAGKEATALYEAYRKWLKNPSRR